MDPKNEKLDVSDDEWEAREFAPAERRHIRQTVAEFERYIWLFKILARIVVGAAAAWTFVWATRDQIARVLRVWLFKGQ